MKTQGYVIARNRARKEYFTATSAYDRPKWIPVAEATVYMTAELAQNAFTKLARNGAYECRVVPVKEAFQFELPSEQPQDQNFQNDDQMEVDITPNDEGGSEMVAADQETPCEVCDHCPCTCDTTEDGVEDLVDAELAGDELPTDDFDSLAAGELDSKMSADGAELAQRLPAGRRGMAESATMPARPPLDAVTPGNKTTALDLKAPETIKFKNPAFVANKPDTDLTNATAHSHEDNVKVPAEVISDLKACIAEFAREAEKKNTHNDTRASFCMTVVSAFEQLLQDLEMGTVEGVKQAQIHMTSYMNPITAQLPLSVQKFITMGGRKPTLKDMFDEKRQERKKEGMFESVHPDIAKKQRAIDRLLASGCSKTHPDVQKLKREIERFKKSIKGE